MIGLMIKDLYQSKTNIIVSIIASIIITSFCIILQIAYICPFIITTLLTTTIAHTITNDKKTGWELIEKTMPIDRTEIIKSKYILYIIILAISSLLGLILLKASSFSMYTKFSQFMPISIISNLIFGSILLPCNFILNADKSYFGMMLSIIFTLFLMIIFNSIYIYSESQIIIGIFSLTSYLTSYKILIKSKNKII